MLLKLMMLLRPRSTRPGANAPTRKSGAWRAPPTFISAMLRSWEERYGATIIELAPGMTRLSVARPPTDPDQSQQLAAEIQACHITGDEITTQPLRASPMTSNTLTETPPSRPACPRSPATAGTSSGDQPRLIGSTLTAAWSPSGKSAAGCRFQSARARSRSRYGHRHRR
jgi:hypothetical protein